MKNSIYKLATLFLTLLLLSCGDDDNTPTSTNEFTISGTDYATPNGYLILDDGPSFTNAFMLGFIDGILIEDNVNGSSISTNTTQGIVLQVDFGGSNVSSEQDVIINNSTTYILTDETTALTNISSFSDTHIINGVTYGEPDNANYFELGLNGNGTVTINNITIDYLARTGTVDCTYSFVDDNGVTVNGQFDGNFEIINEF
jgi:hypothetical protein